MEQPDHICKLFESPSTRSKCLPLLQLTGESTNVDLLSILFKLLFHDEGASGCFSGTASWNAGSLLYASCNLSK